MNLGEKISIISLIVSIIMTLGIFILAKWLDKHSDARQKKYSTLTWINTCFVVIDNAIGEKVSLEMDCQIKDVFDYSSITSHRGIERTVFTILNQYTTIGAAVKNNLIDHSILKQLRGGSLKRTWMQYQDYIEEYRRETGFIGAWEDFEWLATKNG